MKAAIKMVAKDFPEVRFQSEQENSNEKKFKGNHPPLGFIICRADHRTFRRDIIFIDRTRRRPF